MKYYFSEGYKFEMYGEMYYIDTIDTNDDKYPYECYPAKEFENVEDDKKGKLSEEEHNVLMDLRICMSNEELFNLKQTNLEAIIYSLVEYLIEFIGTSDGSELREIFSESIGMTEDEIASYVGDLEEYTEDEGDEEDE